MKKIILGIYLKAKHLIESIKDFNKFHIGDNVIYEGKEYFINNGTAYPFWDICPKEFDRYGKRKSVKVHQNSFKKSYDLWTIKNSLFNHYYWYMNNWYEIELREILAGEESTYRKIIGR